MIKPLLHSKTALIYLIIAAILGVVLRSFQIIEIPVNYKFIVHTHSHIALLGWVYLALSTLLFKLYLSSSNLDRKYSRIFWLTQLTLVGMLLTFPFMGYALFSIIFSTLFLFASYWFSWFLLKNTPAILKETLSFSCIKAALWYLVISSLGPWALGAIMNTQGTDAVLYRLAIYFYLHFLYNGWMMLSLAGLLCYVMENKQQIMLQKRRKMFMWTINLGVILSFFLSTLFANPPLILNILGGLGGLLQLVAFLLLGISFFKLHKKVEIRFSPLQMGMLKTIGVLAALKMILQLLSALPYFAQLAVNYLDFTIGYLHLTFLGVVTIGLFLFLDYFRMLKIPGRSYYLYFCGFIISELLIFYRAIAGWLDLKLINHHTELLAAASSVILFSLIFILAANYSKGSSQHL